MGCIIYFSKLDLAFLNFNHNMPLTTSIRSKYSLPSDDVPPNTHLIFLGFVEVHRFLKTRPCFLKFQSWHAIDHLHQIKRFLALRWWATKNTSNSKPHQQFRSSTSSLPRLRTPMIIPSSQRQTHGIYRQDTWHHSIGQFLPIGYPWRHDSRLTEGDRPCVLIKSVIKISDEINEEKTEPKLPYLMRALRLQHHTNQKQISKER